MHVVRLTQAFWLQCAVAAAAIFALWLVLPFFTDYALSFVHPDEITVQLRTLVHSPSLEWQDFLWPFQWPANIHESRSRWLVSAILLLDLKLRLALYPWFVLPPAFSLAWPFQALAAYLLYRLIVELTLDRVAAALAVLVYVTSVGFLSGFTFYFMPGKSLSGTLYLLALWIMARAMRTASQGQLLHRLSSGTKWAIVAVVFVALLLDELGYFLLVLVPVVFIERFLGRPAGTANAAALLRAGAWWVAPFYAFLVFVLIVTPAITWNVFGLDFTYFSTLLGSASNLPMPARSLFASLNGEGFSLESLATNFLTLFGLSFVPWQLSPLYVAPGTGGVLSSQTANWAQLAILLPLLAGIAILAFVAKGAAGRYFRRFLAATLLCVLFQSLVNGRNVAHISGYYYGAPLSAFSALLIGFSFAALARLRPWTRWLSIALALAIVAIQIDNFYPLNASLKFTHLEVITRQVTYPAKWVAPDARAVTPSELEGLREAWLQGELESYVTAHPVSTGAVFLVEELRWLDHLNVMASLAAGKATEAADNGSAADEATYTLTFKNHRWAPARLEIHANTRARIVVRNLDPTPELFESYELYLEQRIPPEGEAVLHLGPLKPGSYGFFSAFHPNLGDIIVK